MSIPLVPSLRQPKSVTNEEKKNQTVPDIQYVIVTLKDERRKLVVCSDAYHGILTAGDIYKCVFCQAEMKMSMDLKEWHKTSPPHLRQLEKYPPAEEYAENLIRKWTYDTAFCSICNVPVANVSLSRHLKAEVHVQELQRAKTRAASYKQL